MKNSSNKSVLVMMSTYNGAKHLKEQIDSILNQKTVYDVHLRIRDDGSTDGTCGIIEEYLAKYPNRIELVKGNNIGYNASFFSLLQSADGYDYYSLSDQDDVWLSDKIQIACDAIGNENASKPILYASTSYLVHDDMVPYGKTRIKEREMKLYNTIIQNICPGHTQVMNNGIIDLLKDDIDINRIYVYDSWIQNVANLFGTIIFDNTPHTYYRQYEGNQMGYGAGKIGQLLSSIMRDKTGDGLKYRNQIAYFVEKYKVDLMTIGVGEELQKFVESTSFFDRLNYSIHGKLFRQKKLETMAFYFAILSGRF